MLKHWRQFSQQFKAEAVQMMISTGKPIASSAQEASFCAAAVRVNLLPPTAVICAGTRRSLGAIRSRVGKRPSARPIPAGQVAQTIVTADPWPNAT